MPIRPENRAKYPSDWAEISLRVREEAGQKCEWCKKPNGAVVRCASGGRWFDDEGLCWRDKGGGPLSLYESPVFDECKEVKIILTVAHLDHRPEHCNRENLRALCQSCHLTYDAAHHAETRRRTKYENQTELPFNDDE